MASLQLLACLLVVCLLRAMAYMPTLPAALRRTESTGASSTSLFAHHVQKKIIKKKMDTRPIKHRLSDINRRNVNLDKCITKVENAPAEYTIISAADFDKVRGEAVSFWETGDKKAEWLEITEEDMKLALPQNIEPLPEGGVQKRPPLVKSGSC